MSCFAIQMSIHVQLLTKHYQTHRHLMLQEGAFAELLVQHMNENEMNDFLVDNDSGELDIILRDSIRRSVSSSRNSFKSRLIVSSSSLF